MSVEVVKCEKRTHFRDFYELPFLLHKDDPIWVPPLRATVKRILNKKNPFYKQALLSQWVAYDNQKPVGRIAGIINHLHNEYYGQNLAFWGFFEAQNSDEIVSALFKQVEVWAMSYGMNVLRGPMNPSVNYECGLQISAFDTKPFLMMPQNPDYYPALIDHQGYEKIKDLQAWMVHLSDAGIDEKKVNILKRMQNKHRITIRPINMAKFNEEMRLIAHIYNDAWKENWGYLPLDLDEVNYLASELKMIIMPEFIYFAEIDGEPCGFSVGLPDLNQVLHTMRNGRLLPFNFFKLIWHIKIKKSMTQGRIPLLGVLKKYQHLPIGGILYYEYLQKAMNSKCLKAEFSWILEDNEAMQEGLKLVNASHYKTYRVYEKKLCTV